MMAAQEILEPFCELIAARLPIIEAQKFVPLSDFNFTTRNCSRYLLVHVATDDAIETSCSFIARLDWQTVLDQQLAWGLPVIDDVYFCWARNSRCFFIVLCLMC
jgi:hypothetical protein